MAFHIGTSGWSYNHWQGVLYPDKIPVTRRLDFYLAKFGTVELNSSYYRWPKDETFTTWKQRLPPSFRMTVKAPRGLTHAKRLASPEAWISRIAGGVSELGEKMGILLVQLPPDFGCDLPRLAAFLEQSPATWRMAFEFRHPSWNSEEVFALLEARGAAYCIMSGAHLPCILRATAPFVYVRLHGPDADSMYGGSYSDADLGWWAERLREWQAQNRDVYVYFNNDLEGHAVRNAQTLKSLTAS